MKEVLFQQKKKYNLSINSYLSFNNNNDKKRKKKIY